MKWYKYVAVILMALVSIAFIIEGDEFLGCFGILVACLWAYALVNYYSQLKVFYQLKKDMLHADIHQQLRFIRANEHVFCRFAGETEKHYLVYEYHLLKDDDVDKRYIKSLFDKIEKAHK